VGKGGRLAGLVRGIVTAAVVAMHPVGVSGQTLDVGDPLETYLRLLQISGHAETGSFTVRPLVFAADWRMGTSTVHPWSGRLESVGAGDGVAFWTGTEARLRLFANTTFPWGRNDGAVWQGKGATTALDVGGAIGWRSLTVTLQPTLIYNQNSAFDLAAVEVGDQPVYAYPWRVIDYPQRFGPDPFWTVDPGQSEVAVDWRGARVAAGTRNLWWGPAIENPIIMSNNAPGFRHVSLATERPLDIGIGDLEGQWVWGALGQSDWFDPTVTQTDRFFTGIVITYSPAFLPGLSLGGTRVFQELVPDGGVPFEDHFLVLQGLRKERLVSSNAPDGTDERDQLLSLFGRWMMPESGFEVYAEWARNDHSGSLTDFVLEPEHSQAYTMGLQKVTALSPERMVVARLEFVHLEAPPTFQVRPRGVYYEHSVVTQGYTHEGQILGASVGPGGSGQSMGVDLYAPWGMVGFDARRRVTDNDAYWVWAIENASAFEKHDVSLEVGANALLFVHDFDLTGSLTATRELNRYFDGPNLWNLNLGLTAHWRPR